MIGSTLNGMDVETHVSTIAEMEEIYRKRLMMTATGIFIFVIAGGSLSSVAPTGDSTEITLFGVKLLFKDAMYLEWAAVIVMLYYTVRHRQFSVDERRAFKKRIYSECELSDSLVARVNKVMPQLYCNGEMDDFKPVTYTKSMSSYLRESMIEEAYPISVCIRSPISIYVGIDAYNVYSGKVDGSKLYELNGFREHFSFYISYARSYIKCGFEYPDFCHAHLPTVLSVTSFMGYLARNLS